MNQDSNRSEVRTLIVDAGHAGRRIDNFLLNALGGVPKTHLYRLLRRGEIRVNGGRIQPSYRIQEGDKLRIPPLRLEVAGEQAAAPSASLLRLVLASVVIETETFLVINKPAGIAVHGGSGVSFGVIEALRAGQPDTEYLELVHRIDRGTSGCLLLAKDPRFLRGMHELIRAGDIEKSYLALAGGQWQGGERVLAAGLQRNLLRGGERLVQITETGKRAVTVASARERFAEVSLMDICILTGRTHQIRVQLAAAGHPVAGDDKYGDAALNKRMRECGLKQMFLHAHELRFRDPLTGRWRHIRCGLQENHEHVLMSLRAALL
jgi:23S rRNA pseudouridine955/2504/2580 synthase